MFATTTDALSAEASYRRHRIADQFRHTGGRHHHRPRRSGGRDAAAERRTA